MSTCMRMQKTAGRTNGGVASNCFMQASGMQSTSTTTGTSGFKERLLAERDEDGVGAYSTTRSVFVVW